jgi:hypothetical protein
MTLFHFLSRLADSRTAVATGRGLHDKRAAMAVGGDNKAP